MLETHILQPVEIVQQFLPFWRDARFAQEIIDMLLHREGRERTKHMAASDEWKIGRVRMIKFVAAAKIGDDGDWRTAPSMRLFSTI